MGTPNVCFDGERYARALANLQSAGYNVSKETSPVSGNGGCLPELKGKLIDLSTKARGSGNFWVSDSGQAFLTYDVAKLPNGIKAVLGLPVKAGSQEQVMYTALKGFYQCEFQNNMECWSNVRGGIASGKRNIVQQKVATEKRKFEDVLKRADLFWEKARQLIKLAEKCDEGIFGIEASDLQEVYDKYLPQRPSWRPTNMDEARSYETLSEEMFMKMLGKSSAYKSIEEKGSNVGCSMRTGNSTGCDYGESKKASGYTVFVTCSELGIYDRPIDKVSAVCEQKQEREPRIRVRNPMTGEYEIQ